VSISAVYDVPVGKGKAVNVSNSLVNGVIGGWNLGGIFTFRSGQPFNNTASGDIPNTGNVVERADRKYSGCNPYTGRGETI
jgi:hypothetical protein